MKVIHKGDVKGLVSEALRSIKRALNAAKSFGTSSMSDILQYRRTVASELHDALESLVRADVALDHLARPSSASSRGGSRGSKRNPSLVVYNPPGLKARVVNNGRVVGMIGERVYQIRYRHAEDGKDYYHDFGSGVKLFALDNGDVLVTSDKPLWEEFE